MTKRKQARMTLIGALIVGALLAFVCQLTLVYAQDSSGKRIQLHSQNITTLPFGERQFSGGQWAEIANGRCLLCHSRGMIDTQPPMPLAAWKGEIAKMRSAYGCNMNDDEVDGLAQFMYDHNHAIGSASR